MDKPPSVIVPVVAIVVVVVWSDLSKPQRVLVPSEISVPLANLRTFHPLPASAYSRSIVSKTEVYVRIYIWVRQCPYVRVWVCEGA